LALELEDVFSKKAKENQIRTLENRVCQISDEQEIKKRKEFSLDAIPDTGLVGVLLCGSV